MSRLEVPDGLPLVLADPGLLERVLANLFTNALRYSPAGRPPELHAVLDGGTVRLEVVDHGPGIAEEHIPRLTERFYRVSVQESRSRGGTGLGLAIVKHILNRHRGKLAVSSELGKGSSFTLKLPAPKLK